MKHTPVSAVIVSVIAAVMIFCATRPLPAQSEPAPDITIRINRINDIVAAAEDLSKPFRDQSTPSPGQMLHGMLYGTDWIDPARSIVIGIAFSKDGQNSEPDMAALIPFTRKNKNFKSAYPVTEGKDYYLMALPPGQSKAAGGEKEMEKALTTAAKTSAKSLIDVEMAAGRMLEKADKQIQKKIVELQEKRKENAGDQLPEDLAPEDTEKMLTNLLEVGRQLESLGFGLDMQNADLSLTFQSTAREKTRLAEVLADSADAAAATMGNYQPAEDHAIHLRTLPFDNAALLTFFNDNFGAFYTAMGMDMAEIEKFSRYFTGETAGGFSVKNKRVDLEMVMALNREIELPDQFLQKVYLPWIIDYSKSMTKFHQNQPSEKKPVESVFEKSDETTVAGETVTGLTGRISVNGGKGGSDPTVLPIKLRMARLDNHLLMTSGDDRMRQLIGKVKDLAPAEVSGPLGQVKVDLGKLSDALADFGAEPASATSLDDLETMTYAFDIRDRKLSATYTIAMADIKKMGGFFKNNLPADAKSQSRGRAGPTAKTAAADEGSNPSKNSRSAENHPDKSDPRYWIDKGGLYATYGNTDAAIEYFNKALELEPQNSDALFHLALAYAGKNSYQKAIDAINRALEAEPENGRYRYARGWIYQLAGQKEKALADMEKAAELGNPDARDYLENIQPRKQGQ
ncbi:MAG: tetratricopeptide repeat protein [Thermodesulfobacteriota bacterium]